MADLKPHYDRLIAAQANVQSIINQIDAAMQKATPEGEAEALALAPQLDGALEQRDQAQKFYVALQKASTGPNVQAQFVPVSAPQTGDEPEERKTLTLAEYNNLSPKQRLAFAKGDGQISE